MGAEVKDLMTGGVLAVLSSGTKLVGSGLIVEPAPTGGGAPGFAGAVADIKGEAAGGGVTLEKEGAFGAASEDLRGMVAVGASEDGGAGIETEPIGRVALREALSTGLEGFMAGAGIEGLGAPGPPDFGGRLMRIVSFLIFAAFGFSIETVFLEIFGKGTLGG